MESSERSTCAVHGPPCADTSAVTDFTEERLTVCPTSAKVCGHPEPAAEPRLIGPVFEPPLSVASGKICMSFSASPARPPASAHRRPAGV